MFHASVHMLLLYVNEINTRFLRRWSRSLTMISHLLEWPWASILWSDLPCPRKIQVEGFGGKERAGWESKERNRGKIMIRFRKAIYYLHATIFNVWFYQQFVLHGQAIFIVLSAVVSDYIHELFYDSELSNVCSYYIVKLIYFFWSNMIMHWYVVYNFRFILVSWL